MRTVAYSIDCYDHFCVVFDVSKKFRGLGQNIYILMECTPGNHSNFKLSDNIENCELGEEKMELILKLCCRGEKSDIRFLLNPCKYARNYGRNQTSIFVNVQSWDLKIGKKTNFISHIACLAIFIMCLSMYNLH